MGEETAGQDFIDTRATDEQLEELDQKRAGEYDAPDSVEVPDAVVGGPEERAEEMKKEGTFDPDLDEKMAKGVEEDMGTSKEFKL